jgi:DNA-binding LytR/AlgR family response regulator
MLLKTMIIDDELAICSELQFMLQDYIDIQVVSIHHNPIEALPKILELEPDLLFLDIQMPGMNGLEFAKKLNQLSQPPFIIFSTAFHEHALEAFNTPAVAYLTKPIEDSKLDDAIKKIRSLYTKNRASEEKIVPALKDQICIRRNNRIIPLSISNISFAFVKDRDLFIATKDSIDPCDMSLHELETILDQTDYFFRTHRKYIINLRCINEIIPWFNNTYVLEMNDVENTKVPVSRGHIKTFRSIMNL